MKRQPRFAFLLVVAVAGMAIVILLGARGVATPGPTPSASSASTASSRLPTFTHVWVIVLENKGYDQIIGSGNAPYIDQLTERFGLAEAYSAVAKPSQPNYLAMVSGSTHGVADNESHDLTAPTIFDQLEAAGMSWRVFAENVPPDCYTGSSAEGGRDGDGTYVRKHEPAISFTGISGSPGRCANIADLTSFDAAAADFQLIVPNLCHDMHDCSIAEGDQWLGEFVPRILESDAYRSGGLLVITFDEGSDSDERVAAIVAAPTVPTGFRSTTPHTHYSLLRTIGDAWGLDCLGESCSADTLQEFFAPP